MPSALPPDNGSPIRSCAASTKRHTIGQFNDIGLSSCTKSAQQQGAADSKAHSFTCDVLSEATFAAACSRSSPSQLHKGNVRDPQNSNGLS
eukprot:1964624-Amphidinium_carterae.1